MAKSKEKDPNKLGFGRLLLWKSSDVSQAAVSAIVLGFLTLYCTDTLGISPGILGTLLGAFATLPLSYYGVLFIMKCCTYNEMQDMPRMDGSSNILANFTSKFGSALGSAVTGVMLSAAGYVAGDNVTSQPGSALMMIRVLFAIVPAISLVLIGICAKKFVKLEKQIPEWEEKRKAMLEAEAE